MNEIMTEVYDLFMTLGPVFSCKHNPAFCYDRKRRQYLLSLSSNTIFTKTAKGGLMVSITGTCLWLVKSQQHFASALDAVFVKVSEDEAYL